MPKRILEGVVVSDKGDKTVVVKVERTLLHPVLKKTVRLSKKYHAHDEKDEYRVGDVVRIQETRPLSRMKRWCVIGRVERPGGGDQDAPQSSRRDRAIAGRGQGG